MTDFIELWNKAQEIIKNKVNGTEITEYERSQLIMTLAIHFDKDTLTQTPNTMTARPPIPERDTDHYHFTDKGKFPKRIKCKTCDKLLTADKSRKKPGTYYYRCGECEAYTYWSVSGVE